MRQNNTTGKSVKPVQCARQKYSAFVVGQISGLTPPVSPDERGVRTSRTRGGMRWTDQARETHAPGADGEVAWFGRRGAGAKLAFGSAGDGGKRAVLREEREVSRKAIAQGRPGCSACTCMLVCSFCNLRKRHAGPRVREAPGLPCALSHREGSETDTPRVKDAARSRRHVRNKRRAN
jgi:hypothetical protein